MDKGKRSLSRRNQWTESRIPLSRFIILGRASSAVVRNSQRRRLGQIISFCRGRFGCSVDNLDCLSYVVQGLAPRAAADTIDAIRTNYSS